MLPLLAAGLGLQIGADLIGGVVGMISQNSRKKQADEMLKKFQAQHAQMSQQFLASQGMQMPQGQGYPRLV